MNQIIFFPPKPSTLYFRLGKVAPKATRGAKRCDFDRLRGRINDNITKFNFDLNIYL